MTMSPIQILKDSYQLLIRRMLRAQIRLRKILPTLKDRVPNILGRLEPTTSFRGVGVLGDLLVSGQPVPSPSQHGTMLRDFPFLPQQTRSEPMTEVESWFRQDSRLTHDDIYARNPSTTSPLTHLQKRAFSDRRDRIRNRFNMITWNTRVGGQKKQKLVLKLLDTLTQEQIDRNTTWVVTSTHIHPPGRPNQIISLDEYLDNGFPHQPSDNLRGSIAMLQNFRNAARAQNLSHWQYLQGPPLPATWRFRPPGALDPPVEDGNVPLQLIHGIGILTALKKRKYGKKSQAGEAPESLGSAHDMDTEPHSIKPRRGHPPKIPRLSKISKAPSDEADDYGMASNRAGQYGIAPSPFQDYGNGSGSSFSRPPLVSSNRTLGAMYPPPRINPPTYLPPAIPQAYSENRYGAPPSFGKSTSGQNEPRYPSYSFEDLFARPSDSLSNNLATTDPRYTQEDRRTLLPPARQSRHAPRDFDRHLPGFQDLPTSQEQATGAYSDRYGSHQMHGMAHRDHMYTQSFLPPSQSQTEVGQINQRARSHQGHHSTPYLPSDYGYLGGAIRDNTWEARSQGQYGGESRIEPNNPYLPQLTSTVPIPDQQGNIDGRSGSTGRRNPTLSPSLDRLAQSEETQVPYDDEQDGEYELEEEYGVVGH